MTTNKPEVVAWRWRKPVVDDRGETVEATAWELSDAPGFLPWWTNDPLIRLSDYESLQAAYERLRKHLQSLIDQTTPLVPEPGNPMWSRRIQLEEAIAERDSLRAEREKLRKDAERYRWLRSHDRASDKQHECGMSPPGTVGMVFVSEGDGCEVSAEGDDLDAAIDTAMQGDHP